MSNWNYIKIRSWHIVRTPTRVPDTYVTVCGRTATGTTIDYLGEGRSCESCLRYTITAIDNSEPLPEDDASTQPVEMIP